MSNQFDYFVILAEMRTGSNFLEATVNSYPGLTCWGEAYNPAFVGKANSDKMCGVSKAQREQNPNTLLEAMKSNTEGLAGFRFFHNHDPRMFNHFMDDPKCAKIILTRNPLESYVSKKIADQTGQWRLGDLKDARTAKVTFEKREFETMLDAIKTFQVELQRRLQVSGQTGFYINYEDIKDIEVVNGLARFLGVDVEQHTTSQQTKVQNPSQLKDKVNNFAQMVTELSDVDHFNLASTPNFEPRRGPAVPSYVAAANAPLLYLPVRSGPEATVRDWMCALDSVEQSDLTIGFSQKTLRQWKRRAKEHRSFTVISHPVARLHRAFCTQIVSTGEESFGEIRDVLRTTYKVDVPADGVTDGYSKEQHKAAFLAFIDFVKGNLNAQTSVRVDPSWASQSEIIKGFSEFSMPDMIVREETLERDLTCLARAVGIDPILPLNPIEDDKPFSLAAIYDEDIEQAVKQAYQRDYMMFGFRAFR
ncbi:sulfotransferase family 2 domain-containing protein [Celeribacter marinus]|uniref:sulfotransferase family 2 domain-containing protein n=1 Tax=Celeribacter marinus TaxID=1397108 RepID=UPI00317897B3